MVRLEYRLVRTLAKQLKLEEARRETFPFDRDHVERAIVIKGDMVMVDEGIVPVVVWLNSIHGVQTLFSCQGSDSNFPPYVIFRGSAVLALQVFRRYMDQFRPLMLPYQNIIVETDWWDGFQRFKVKWHDHLSLLDFTGWLKVNVLTPNVQTIRIVKPKIDDLQP